MRKVNKIASAAGNIASAAGNIASAAGNIATKSAAGNIGDQERRAGNIGERVAGGGRATSAGGWWRVEITD